LKYVEFLWGKTMKYRVVVEQDEDGVYVAECPTLPGCISQGKTRNDALENIKDAIQGYLESLKKHNEPIPPSIQEEYLGATNPRFP
jgi:antitoxin HicB